MATTSFGHSSGSGGDLGNTDGGVQDLNEALELLRNDFELLRQQPGLDESLRCHSPQAPSDIRFNIASYLVGGLQMLLGHRIPDTVTAPVFNQDHVKNAECAVRTLQSFLRHTPLPAPLDIASGNRTAIYQIVNAFHRVVQGITATRGAESATVTGGNEDEKDVENLVPPPPQQQHQQQQQQQPQPPPPPPHQRPSTSELGGDGGGGLERALKLRESLQRDLRFLDEYLVKAQEARNNSPPMDNHARQPPPQQQQQHPHQGHDDDGDDLPPPPPPPAGRRHRHKTHLRRGRRRRGGGRRVRRPEHGEATVSSLPPPPTATKTTGGGSLSRHTDSQCAHTAKQLLAVDRAVVTAKKMLGDLKRLDRESRVLDVIYRNSVDQVRRSGVSVVSMSHHDNHFAHHTLRQLQQTMHGGTATTWQQQNGREKRVPLGPRAHLLQARASQRHVREELNHVKTVINNHMKSLANIYRD